ncbi:aldehyde dehydrogenase family protein [Dongia sedimenti]|uniref:Aldehyde dehydrogenase family protein n=1 Tax=Dongia sedimenti TaxID=3064282 RepID=A0ABU0YI35_9PROT|nr:aldehyde dehydrogenase family protein [Rhodospirillaceae bacterium R-7]
MLEVPHFSAADVDAARRRAGRLDAPWIGDAYRRSNRAARRDTLSPYDGTLLNAVELGDAAAVDAAVDAAAAALRGPWGRLDPAGRAALIRNLAQALETLRLELALLETLDVGKPILHAWNDDVPTAVGVLRWYASLVETAYDVAPSRRGGTLIQIAREPRGVIGIVLPWNYPLTTLALKLGPALAAGNTVVCKPAEDTPLTTLRLAELAIEAGLPAGVVNVVPGLGGVAGKAIGLHPGIAAINFTGSTATGRQFLRYSADSNLKEVSLECGGKNPAIILDDADLARSGDEIATGFLMNSGQLCSSISRILAPRSLESPLRALLAEKMAAWPVGDPLDPRTRIGPLVSDAHAAKVTRAIAAAAGDGLTSAAASTGSSPRLVRPVAFFDAATESGLWRDEIFGPVLAVRFYDDLEEALASANDTEYGLSAYVFGEDARRVTSLAERLDAGFVAVNAFCEGDLTTPFGGFKTSGFGGKDKGIHSLDQYARTKSIWWNAVHP